MRWYGALWTCGIVSFGGGPMCQSGMGYIRGRNAGRRDEIVRSTVDVWRPYAECLCWLPTDSVDEGRGVRFVDDVPYYSVSSRLSCLEGTLISEVGTESSSRTVVTLS